MREVGGRNTARVLLQDKGRGRSTDRPVTTFFNGFAETTHSFAKALPERPRLLFPSGKVQTTGSEFAQHFLRFFAIHKYPLIALERRLQQLLGVGLVFASKQHLS